MWFAFTAARSFVTDTSTLDLAPEVVDELAEEVTRVPAVAWREMFSSLLEYDDIAELSDVRAPVALVWGDADPLVSRQMQDELVRRLPTAALDVYPGVGHTPRWEQPERYADGVMVFASRLLT